MQAHHLDITAVVMSPKPMRKNVPGAVVLNHVSRFATVANYSRQRAAAIRKVRTARFVCIDSDDELPDDFEDVLAECCQLDAALVYTDELVINIDGKTMRRESAGYSQDSHIRNPLLVHHLAVCDTASACAALDVLPGGDVLLDTLLYFQLAKKSVAYVPRIGYHWNRGNGMHTWKDNLRCMVSSSIWCSKNRGSF